jgi:hypothetical protein
MRLALKSRQRNQHPQHSRFNASLRHRFNYGESDRSHTMVRRNRLRNPSSMRSLRFGGPTCLKLMVSSQPGSKHANLSGSQVGNPQLSCSANEHHIVEFGSIVVLLMPNSADEGVDRTREYRQQQAAH